MADERKRGGLGIFSILLILVLVGVVLWLLADRNARTWYLIPDEGRLLVLRGVNLPYGRKAPDPSTPGAEAYTPVVAPPGVTLPPEQSFDGQSALDQALFAQLSGWAHADVASGAPDRLARGLDYLHRAERLPAISAAQRDELATLRAESGYFEAQGLLEKVSVELKDATDRLRAAAASRSAHATDARLLLRDLEPAADAILSSVRKPGVARPAPAVEAAPPGARPAAPPAAGATGPEAPK